MGLSGWIDVAQRNRLAGWASRPGVDGTPVTLVLAIAATLRMPARQLGRFLANRYRPDLDPRDTGYEGRAGFDLDLTEFDLPPGSFLLDVAEERSGERLPGAPQFIPAADFPPAPPGLLLTELDGDPICRLPADVLACLPRREGRLRVDLPPHTSGIMLCPRARRVPGDLRLLGAVVSRIALASQPVDLADPALVFGFHPLEGDPGHHWRWIDDAAFISIGANAAGCTVEIDLHGMVERAAPRRHWHMSAAYRIVTPAAAAVPHVGSRFLAPPLAPAKRRQKIAPIADTRYSPCPLPPSRTPLSAPSRRRRTSSSNG